MSAPDVLAVLLRIAAISAVVYFALALALIASQRPAQELGGKTLDFAALRLYGREAAPAPLETYKARDGATLGVRRYPSRRNGAPLLVFLHGSGWHGGAYDGLARQIAEAGAADVLVPDLRGHGPLADPRGDIAYVGQFEDDIADLVTAELKPGQRLVLGGHSSGGGLVIRYAGGHHGATLDGAVLLAPFLKYKAPTMRPNSGGWARPLTRRIIGLTMLNALGLRVLDGLTVIQFAFPASVLAGAEGKGATDRYSHRLNTAYAPRSDYLGDIATLPPFLLLAGSHDEAFRAEAYEPTMRPANPAGSYEVIDGADHLGLIRDPRAADKIVSFLSNLAPRP